MAQFDPVLLPVVHRQQDHPSDCLAASADMVLKYLGAPKNYRRLLKVLRIDPQSGTPFFNIIRLEALRVTVVFQQGTLVVLHRFLTNGWPVIVPIWTGELPHWTENTDHAVVVVGMDERSVYLNDPAFATAPIQVPHGDFDLAWLEREEYYAVLAP